MFRVRVVKFDGLGSNGDAFGIGLRTELIWTDPRVPWDAGTYADSQAEQMIALLWTPKLKLSGATVATSQLTLTIQRDSVNEENDWKESQVNVTLGTTRTIQHIFKPDFQEFPFDWHPLDVMIDAESPTVELRLIDSTVEDLVPEDSLSAWNEEWPPHTKNAEWVYIKAVVPGKSYEFHVAVERKYVITVFRLIFPMSCLVVLSWSGFYINPARLMPRFASGFIAFLSLQGFKAYAVKLMPNDGKINAMSWIDIYISIVGLMMVLAVVETVATQYVWENVSRTVAIVLDRTAQKVFPFTYVLVVVLLCLPLGSNAHLVLSHVIVAALVIVYGAYIFYEAHYWPHLYITRNVSGKLSGAKRHREHSLTRREIQVIFDMIEKMDGACESGVVHVDVLLKWLIRQQKELEKSRNALRALLIAVLQGEEFGFPAFEHEFPRLITQMTLLLHGHIHHDEESGDIKDSSKKMGSLKHRKSERVLPSDATMGASKSSASRTTTSSNQSVTVFGDDDHIDEDDEMPVESAV